MDDNEYKIMAVDFIMDHLKRYSLSLNPNGRGTHYVYSYTRGDFIASGYSILDFFPLTVKATCVFDFGYCNTNEFYKSLMYIDGKDYGSEPAFKKRLITVLEII